MRLEYRHVDVFSQRPYGGNSLPVFLDARSLSAVQMLGITQELRHFEAIFLEPQQEPGVVRARVFDLLQELRFAGHPVIGAAAVLHDAAQQDRERTWHFELSGRRVSVVTKRTKDGYFGFLEQGAPEHFGPVNDGGWVAPAFGLEQRDLRSDLPLEVVSTGLRYLIVPVVPGALQRACIARDISALLSSVNAEYAVLFDETSLEIRHWSNDGVLEDVATGSAAGTIGSYRLRHGLVQAGEIFVLNQGRFAGRPSTLQVQPQGTRGRVANVRVGGDVALVGRGVLEIAP
jgi:trans-2,3-dihydro-3-hydroxyanthranilate isomerase